MWSMEKKINGLVWCLYSFCSCHIIDEKKKISRAELPDTEKIKSHKNNTLNNSIETVWLCCREKAHTNLGYAKKIIVFRSKNRVYVWVKKK